jgi:hypothetical protein
MPIDFTDRPCAPTDLQALLNIPVTTTVVTEASNCKVSSPAACELLDEPAGPLRRGAGHGNNQEGLVTAVPPCGTALALRGEKSRLSGPQELGHSKQQEEF